MEGKILKTYTTNVTIEDLPGKRSDPSAGMRAAVEAHVNLQQLQEQLAMADGVVGDLIERACREAKNLGIKCKPPQDPSPTDANDFVAELLKLAGDREDLTKLTYFTVEQAAKYLQVSKDKIYDLCKSGELPNQRVGRVIRIKRSDLDQMSVEDDW